MPQRYAQSIKMVRVQHSWSIKPQEKTATGQLVVMGRFTMASACRTLVAPN